MTNGARDGDDRWLLTTIRAVHSAIFLVMLSAIAWVVATGIAGRRDRSVAVAGGLVAIESGVFLANRGVCPLTPLAERHGARRGGVSDIFLPDAVARTIPIWATSLVVLGVALHIRGLARTWTDPKGRSPGSVVVHDVARPARLELTAFRSAT